MSFSRRQALSFAAQGAALRRKISGQPATYGSRALCIAASAVRTHRDMEGSGFEVLPDFIARVDRAAYPWFTPVLGSNLVFGGLAYKITEIAPILDGGEWRLGLKKP